MNYMVVTTLLDAKKLIDSGEWQMVSWTCSQLMVNRFSFKKLNRL